MAKILASLLVLVAAVTARGQGASRVERASINLCQSSEDLSTWTTAAGTPGRALNAFADSTGLATCDTVTDDDAGAQEGYQTASFTTTPGTYTFSCELAAGTASSVLLRVSLTGTSVTGHGTACTVTSIAAAATRYSCSATIGGSPLTAALWQVRVGNASSVTGTLHVCRCQIVQGSTPATYSGPTGASSKSNRVALRKKNRI